MLNPRRGQWYKRSDLNAIFEVVALDDDDGTIEVQYFNGEIEEIDQTSWSQLPISQASQPEDWSGALEVDSYSLSDKKHNGPASLNEALNIIDNLDK